MQSKVDVLLVSLTVSSALFIGLTAHAADPCVGVCSIYADDAVTVTRKVDVSGATADDLNQACALDAGYFDHAWSVEVTTCPEE